MRETRRRRSGRSQFSGRPGTDRPLNQHEQAARDIANKLLCDVIGQLAKQGRNGTGGDMTLPLVEIFGNRYRLFGTLVGGFIYKDEDTLGQPVMQISEGRLQKYKAVCDRGGENPIVWSRSPLDSLGDAVECVRYISAAKGTPCRKKKPAKKKIKSLFLSR